MAHLPPIYHTMVKSGIIYNHIPSGDIQPPHIAPHSIRCHYQPPGSDFEARDQFNKQALNAQQQFLSNKRFNFALMLHRSK
jgi:hypothetical protein